MGNSSLDRGLWPLVDEESTAVADFQVEWLWLIVGYHAHRLRGRPIAEVLAAWTNILLLHKGINPTVGDIAKASGLPRATVSRYIDHNLNWGWAAERVNPEDRRRRELYLTEAGEKELDYIVEFFHEMFHDLVDSRPEEGASETGEELIGRLKRLSETINRRLSEHPSPE